MSDLYEGFILTKGKESAEKLKGRTTFKTLEEVKNAPSYGGVLAADSMFIDIDDSEQSEIMMNIVEDMQLDCKVLCTSRGRHAIFKNHEIKNNFTKVHLACGLTADIKVGFQISYEILKLNGEERFCEWDIKDDEITDYQEIPKYFYPVKNCDIDFANMGEGDGRNSTLYSYILTLQNNDFTVEEIRETIRIMNKFVLKEPLADAELETILRDEAFQKPTFFMGSTFHFDRFANYIRQSEHIIKINGQLHVHRGGIYIHDMGIISGVMRSYLPNIKRNQKAEVLDYLNDTTEEKQMSDVRYIAFNNGVYDIATGELKPFSAEMVITNKIPWDYKPDAYSELADKTLNKLACNDTDIRALLEECIGYCFYRMNNYKKSFMLTGEHDNGKSTFLDCIKAILGDENISALDLKELGDRFNTSMMYGKLANIGDDIGDDFLQGSQVAVFKKVVAGNRIKAERKGQDPFEFNPFVKLLFSANDIPHIRDKTGAVLSRLIIIPFKALFTKDDPDYDPLIKQKLLQRESMEYFVRVGIEGLERLIENRGFTKSVSAEEAAQEYELMNDPIKGFFAEQEEDYISRHDTKSLYAAYQIHCSDCGVKPETKIAFGKSVANLFKVESKNTRVAGEQLRFYKKV